MISTQQEMNRILLFGKSESDYHFFKNLLKNIKNSRYHIDWTDDYDFALNKTGSNEYQVFMVPFEYKGNSWKNFLENMKKTGCFAPLIIYSENTARAESIDCAKGGAADYIGKNYLDTEKFEQSLVSAIERSKTIHSLYRKLSHFKGLWKGLPVGLLLFDANGRIIDYNPTMNRIFGLNEDELCKRNFFDMLETRTRTQIKPSIEKIVEGKNLYDRFEERLFIENGNTIFSKISISAFQDDNSGFPILIAAIEDITEQKKSEQSLRKSQKQFEKLSALLMDFHEKEGRRIALKLYDSVAGKLATIFYSIQNKLLQIPKENSQSIESIEQELNLIQNTIEETRKIFGELPPTILDDLGLILALKGLCREYSKRNPKIHIKNTFEIRENDVPDYLKNPVLRIAQEALENAFKHSESDLVELTFKKKDHQITLRVSDNGNGFEFHEDLYYDGGMGLISMKKRTELNGGQFTLTAKPDKGVSIMADWPLDSQ